MQFRGWDVGGRASLPRANVADAVKRIYYGIGNGHQDGDIRKAGQSARQ